MMLIRTHAYHRLKEKEQEVIEAVPEEVLMPYFESENTSDEMKSYAGISYKEKLKQRRNKKIGGGESGASSSSAAPPATAAPTVEESLPAAPPPTPQAQVETAKEQPKQQVAKPTPPTAAAQDKVQPLVSNEPPKQQTSAPPTPVQQPAVPAAVSGDSSSNTKTGLSEASTEDVRQKIRNLMGMTLKHRGGLGFGKGRLKGPEIDRFEKMLGEVTALLQEEAMQLQETSSSVPPPPPPPQTVSEDVTAAATALPAEPAPTEPSPENAEAIAVEPVSSSDASQADSSTIAVATSAPSDSAQVDSVIACIEGAIMMYKNSPPELKEGVLFSLRGALNSALNTCDKVIGRNVVSNAPSQPEVATVAAAEPAAPTAEVVDSPPLEVQEPPAPEPVAVVQEPAPAVPVVTPATSGSGNIGADANSKVLEEIYSEIKSASGDGRLGLKSDLSQDDASRVANKIEEMRSLLMEELDAGIPDAKASTVPAAAESSPSSSAGSKYQQMLAKARAAKASS